MTTEMPKRVAKTKDITKLRSTILRQQARIARMGALIELQRNRIDWSDDTCRRLMGRLEEVYAGKTPAFHDPDQSRSRKARKGRTTTS